MYIYIYIWPLLWPPQATTGTTETIFWDNGGDLLGQQRRSSGTTEAILQLRVTKVEAVVEAGVEAG